MAQGWREFTDGPSVRPPRGHYGSIKLFRMAYLTSIVQSCTMRAR